MPVRPDPLTNFRFLVEIEGVSAAGFSACDGLEIEVDVIEYREGADRTGGQRKLPGQTRYRNIVLRRGLTQSADLWNWFQSVTDGDVQRRNVSIILLNSRREEELRFNAFEAWPCRWKSLQLDASGKASVIEELELAVERIERA